jgi:predicted hydrocarbon binding protein
LKPGRWDAHALLYSPKVRGFHIIIELKDVPGAFSSVLELLERYVDLTSTVSYATDRGTAVWSIFGKAISKSVTEEALRRVISCYPFVEDSEVVGSEGGLVFDRFHSGTQLGPGLPLVSISIRGLVRMFDRLTEDFGSGGEAILFEEGHAHGQATGDYLRGMFGAQLVKKRIRQFISFYGALGWGRASLSIGKQGKVVSVRVEDCFEASERKSPRHGCNFTRGHLVGLVSSYLRTELTGEETKCRLRGDPYCEFVLEEKSRLAAGIQDH